MPRLLIGRLFNGNESSEYRRCRQVLSLFFTLEKEFRDLERLHDLFRQVMARLIAKDKKVRTVGR